MKVVDDITGKNALKKVDATAAEMERIYTALATRVMEVLDRQEQLATKQSELLDLEVRLQKAQSQLQPWATSADAINAPRKRWAVMTACSFAMSVAAVAIAILVVLR